LITKVTEQRYKFLPEQIITQDFFLQVKSMYPNTVRMILSGYTDLKSVTDSINRGSIYKFLTKPWDDNLLRQEIANAFKEAHQNKLNNSQTKLTETSPDESQGLGYQFHIAQIPTSFWVRSSVMLVVSLVFATSARVNSGKIFQSTPNCT